MKEKIKRVGYRQPFFIAALATFALTIIIESDYWYIQQYQ
jgi:hypothetical protein